MTGIGVRLLVDTHALLWWPLDDTRLSPAARATLADRGNAVFVSAASVWEIAIKTSLGKLPLPPRGDALITDAIIDAGFTPLPVTFAHAFAVQALPWHHRDPFDRLLIAQGTLEGLTLLTADHLFRPYGIAVLW